MSRRGGGIEAVSNFKAEQIWKDLCIHDDGVVGHGGTNALILGSQGSGKTTIGTYLVNKFHYVPDVKKDIFFAGGGAGMYPETVLWAGSNQDYWNIFLRNRFERAFPEAEPRQLRVFVHQDDKYEFFERAGQDKDVTKEIDVQRYKDQDELMSNLAIGGLNVIYPPSYYTLSMHLKEILNSRMMLGPKDPRFYDEEKSVSVPSFVFLYELLEYIYSVRGYQRSRQWYSFILDECHKYFPYGVKAPLWHLVDWLAEMLADTRRANLSLYGFTHSMSVLDFRVKPRFNYFIWLPGSKPDPEFSRVEPNLIMQLSALNEKYRSQNIRWAINERKREIFGKFPFPDILGRPPLLVARCDSTKAMERKAVDEDPLTQHRCPDCGNRTLNTRKDGSMRCWKCGWVSRPEEITVGVE